MHDFVRISGDYTGYTLIILAVALGLDCESQYYQDHRPGEFSKSASF
jgi:hypothetical protein